MNKYNFERAGFEVNRVGRQGASRCGCASQAQRYEEIKGRPKYIISEKTDA